MEHRYKPVSVDEGRSETASIPRFRSSRTCWAGILAVVSLSNICMLFLSLYAWREAGWRTNSASDISPVMETSTAGPRPDLSDRIARVDELPIEYVPFRWHTPWGGQNVTIADRLWENLNTAHGHIAVDHDWAAANQWQPSLDVPGMPGKGLYLLQAYHQLHCLRIIRSLFLSMHHKGLPQYPFHHALHCFDAIRQHIMCNADNTPLYGNGDGTSGDGQVHQCKSWTALRDYATRNTACFRDGEPGMTVEERFGICDDGTDGLEDAA